MRDDDQAKWNRKAETFPRYEPGEDTYEAGMLRTVRELGVDFRGKSVLDVGCGSGMFTLRIAQEAARVTALDVSGRMLELLREDAARLGIRNIECVHAGWDDFDRAAVYDVVFCSMTPAIQSEESRRKLLRHAGGWTVFLGYAGLMSSDMLNGLYAAYGITPRIYDNGTRMREWLEARSIAHTMRLVEGQWVQRRDKEETIAACASMLDSHGVTPERAFMDAYLADFEQEPGVYVERTDYRIELLLWDKAAGEAGLPSC